MAEKEWTDAEILAMWPQAAGELRGFQRALEQRSGITALQIGMALNLADRSFRELEKNSDKILAIGCVEVQLYIEGLRNGKKLKPGVQKKLEHHLESCADCKRENMTADGKWSCTKEHGGHPTFAAAAHCMMCSQ